MSTYLHLWQNLAEFLLEWEMFQERSSKENRNTHFTINNLGMKIVPFKGWKNMEEPDRPQTKT